MIYYSPVDALIRRAFWRTCARRLDGTDLFRRRPLLPPTINTAGLPGWTVLRDVDINLAD